MRKLFFLLYSMNVGGVERAFLGLLSTIPTEANEIHLGLIHRKGELLEQLPNTVHVHEIKNLAQQWTIINDPPLWNIKALLRQWKLWEAFVHLLLYAHFKLTGTRWQFYRYLLRHEPMMAGEYDVAVAFAGPSQMIDYFVYSKVRAREKYGWIHFDISKFGIDAGMTARIYKHYNKIFVVSEEARKIFASRFPQLADKTEVRYNVIAKGQIAKMAGEGPTFSDDYGGSRILTVGRVSPEKGQRLAIEALSILRKEGHDVRWYFVGEGSDLAFCKQLAAERGLAADAVFLGLQTNPYGYMRGCDIYVQPSLHEGFCITLAEALCFDHPIVTTNFTGAREQLKDKQDCCVTDTTAKALAEGIGRTMEYLKSKVSEGFKEKSSGNVS